MSDQTQWLNFDVHQRLGIRVDKRSPAAAQLLTMLDCFSTTRTVPADISVSAAPEDVDDAAELEDELAYTERSVTFNAEQVQVVRDGDAFRIHGRGELLTALVPILDRAMVQRGAAMIHAATVTYRGHAVALPAGGGTGKTSTVAKLMKRDGYTFMGDDWAFLAEDQTLLGYEKPMFIKPHHRTIYPHLFTGARKPMVPPSLSRPVGHITTKVHPYVIRYPKVADFSRRWSPEHRMVSASKALPGTPVTKAAPLFAVVYVERYRGDEIRLREVDEEWMVDRMMGNFHVEMARFSQEMVTGMAAASFIPWRGLVQDKCDVLHKAIGGIPCRLLQLPAEWSADRASDEAVSVLEELLPPLLRHPARAT